MVKSKCFCPVTGTFGVLFNMSEMSYNEFVYYFWKTWGALCYRYNDRVYGWIKGKVL